LEVNAGSLPAGCSGDQAHDAQHIVVLLLLRLAV
jgi:hypothetical protein